MTPDEIVAALTPEQREASIHGTEEERMAIIRLLSDALTEAVNVASAGYPIGFVLDHPQIYDRRWQERYRQAFHAAIQRRQQEQPPT